jgi:RNA polymerase sigma-70 factor (ECF subfamily)
MERFEVPDQHQPDDTEPPERDRELASNLQDALLDDLTFVRRLARRLSRGRQEAEELEQRVWLAALIKKPSQERSLRPWLVEVAKNISLAMRRGEATRRQREKIYARERAEWQHPSPSGDDSSQRLAAVVGSLDDESKNLLHLRYTEGLNYAEMAMRLGIQEQTARTRHFRVLKQMRTRLSGAQEPAQTKTRAWIPWWLGGRALKSVAALLILLIGGWAALPLVAGTGQHSSSAVVQGHAPDSLEEVPDAMSAGRMRVAEGRLDIGDHQPMELGAHPDLHSQERLEVRVYDTEGRPSNSGEVQLYRVIQDEPGLATVGAPVPVLNGVATIEGATVGTWVVATEGQEVWSMATSVDLAFALERPLTVRLLEPMLVIDGVVVDEQGLPIPGAVIGRGWRAPLNPVRDEFGSQTASAFARSTTTDAAGRFRLVSMESVIRPRLLATCEGYAPAVVGGRFAERVVLQKETTLRGRVWTAAGTVGAGAKVAILKKANITLAEQTADEAGRFEFANSPTGSVVVHATLGSAASQSSVELDSENEVPLELRLEEGRTIQGKLRNASGEVLAGWTIRCRGGLHSATPLETQVVVRVMREMATKTNGSGEFTFHGVPEGNQVLVASAPGWLNSSDSPSAAAPAFLAHWTIGMDDDPVNLTVGEVSAEHVATVNVQRSVLAAASAVGVESKVIVGWIQDSMDRPRYVSVPRGASSVELEGLTAGRLLVQVQEEGGRSAAWTTCELPLRDSLSLTLPTREDLTVVVESAAPLKSTSVRFRAYSGTSQLFVSDLQLTPHGTEEPRLSRLRFAPLGGEIHYVQVLADDGSLFGLTRVDPTSPTPPPPLVLGETPAYSIELHTPPELLPMRQAWIQILDASGEVAYCVRPRKLAPSTTTRFRVRLEPGAYTLRVPGHGRGDLPHLLDFVAPASADVSDPIQVGPR